MTFVVHCFLIFRLANLTQVDSKPDETADRLSADVDALLTWLNSVKIEKIPESPSADELVRQATALLVRFPFF